MLIGVKSSALKLGAQTKPWLLGFTGLMTGGLTAAGLLCHMTWPYYVAVALTTGRLTQQVSETSSAFCKQVGFNGAILFSWSQSVLY